MPLSIHCRDLRKTYRGRPPVEAVRGIDLEVRDGECFGVLGPNGAGKTTTIEILEGVLEPTAGTVEILGLQWKKNSDAIRQQIGVSLQETQLSERLSVIETLRMFRSFYRTGLEPEVVLEHVSLTEKSKSWVKKLSGGQKQRLSVACALVGDPKLLFLDEPTTGLDPSSRRDLWDIIRQYRARGRTVLLTTHYMDEAERLCDRVAIVDHGKVIALGTPSELIGQLGSDYVIEFSGNTTTPDEAILTQLRGISGVNDVEHLDSRFRLRVEQPHQVLPPILKVMAGTAIDVSNLTTRHASLEDVFVQITGREFEQEEEKAAT